MSTRKGDDNILSLFELFAEITLLAQSNASHFYALSILCSGLIFILKE